MVLWMALAMLGLVVTVLTVNTVNSHPDSMFGDVMRTTDLWLRDSRANELGIAPRNRIIPIAVVTYLLLVAFGASAVGAEYRAGTVTTILTWEPRRIRLLSIRFLAIALVAMGFFVVTLGVFVAGWTAGAALNGTSRGADGEFWGELLVVLARGTLVAGVLAVLSGALATLGRNTAAALGIWFGYLVGVEAILQANVKAVTPWMLLLNVGAFFQGESVSVSRHTLEPASGAVVMAVYLVVVAGGALAVFARRDVT